MSSFSERITALALKLVDDEETGAHAHHIPDIAHELCEIANELEGFDLEPQDGQFPTPRQALALGRMLDHVMRDEQYERKLGYSHARVTRGGFGCGPNYLTWELGDGYHGGIDREGRVST